MARIVLITSSSGFILACLVHVVMCYLYIYKQFLIEEKLWLIDLRNYVAVVKKALHSQSQAQKKEDLVLDLW